MIETKDVIILGYPTGDRDSRKQYEKCQNYINDLTSFGWQKTQEVLRHHGRTSSRVQVLARETSMPNYTEYVKYENEYEAAKGEIKNYNPMELSTIFLLLILFIVPGVLYIAFKSNQKSNINNNNQQCHEKMQHAVVSAKNIK